MTSSRSKTWLRFVAYLVVIGLINSMTVNLFATTQYVDDKKVSREDDKEKDDSEVSLPDLPEGLTSFGGAVSNGKLYVFGGHRGKAHHYYKTGQNAKLLAIDLKKSGKWEVVNESVGRQGLAMVAHRGKIYRLGGFVAKNKKVDKQDLHSIDEFAVFDPEKKSWVQLAKMPEARSSFDAVILGNTIYAIGGWALAGEGNTKWSSTAYSIDLSADELQWKKLAAPPFKRRAVSVGHQDGKVIVVGGMQNRGGPTRKVAIYDPKAQKWSDGPELPKVGKSNMEGFGSSCFNINGRLVVSTYGGNVYSLSKDMSKWEKMFQLETGRFFHRLLPVGKKSFVLVGGANMSSGKVEEVEIFTFKSK